MTDRQSQIAFLFSDLHASRSMFLKIMKFLTKTKGISLLLFAGDFLNAGQPYSFSQELINNLKSLDKPLIWVTGNNDFGDNAALLGEHFPPLSTGGVQLFGWHFVGINEYEISRSLAHYSPVISLTDSILITHYPPPRLKYVKSEKDLDRETPQDNSTFKNALLLYICGHLHNQQGLAYVGKTKVVKVGSSVSGDCAVMDLGSLKVDFIKL